MLIRIFACAITGIDAVTVTIEVNESRGVQFFLVRLAYVELVDESTFHQPEE